MAPGNQLLGGESISRTVTPGNELLGGELISNYFLAFTWRVCL